MTDFNDHRKKIVNPGHLLTLDECMSPFEGQSDLLKYGGAPGMTKIIRKPKGVGHELKAILYERVWSINCYYFATK